MWQNKKTKKEKPKKKKLYESGNQFSTHKQKGTKELNLGAPISAGFVWMTILIGKCNPAENGRVGVVGWN